MPTIIVAVAIQNNGPGAMTRVIPRGTIIEVADPNTNAQSATVARDYTVTLPPGTKSIVYLEALCIEPWKSWPAGAPGNLTPYAFQGPYMDQDDLWQQL